MLHGCDGLEGGMTLRALTGANYLQNSKFLQQLSRTALLSSDINGHSVSVQTSSGVVIGCGRLETLFPVNANYRGKHVLSQFIQYFPANVPDVSKLDIRQHYILEGIAGTCSRTAALFDPWSPPGLKLGTAETNDLIPVGDLPGHDLWLFNFIFEVPLIGNATILGHAVSKAYISHRRLITCALMMSLPPFTGACSL